MAKAKPTAGKKGPIRPSDLARPGKRASQDSKAPRYRSNPLERRGTTALPRPGAPAPTKPVELPEDVRIESIPLESLMPDPQQGRMPLPTRIGDRFRAGELSPEEAVREWRGLAEGSPRVAERLKDYESLAVSLVEHEQIEPTVVYPIPPTAAGVRYQIESGERRFWGAWIGVVSGTRTDRTLKAVVKDKLDVRRQTAENAMQSALTAVELARTAARVVLHELGVTPETSPVAIDPTERWAFHRLALLPPAKLQANGRDRLPRGLWDTVEKALRQKRQRIELLIQVLALPNAVLDIAQDYELNELVLRTLRESGAPEERLVKVAQAAANHGLIARDVQRLCLAADLGEELKRVLAERGADGATGVGATPKPAKRATPAKHAHGYQLAQRLSGLLKTVQGVAKGRGGERSDVVRDLLRDAVRLQPDAAKAWLEELRLMVEELESIVAQQPPEG